MKRLNLLFLSLVFISLNYLTNIVWVYFSQLCLPQDMFCISELPICFT